VTRTGHGGFHRYPGLTQAPDRVALPA
jgi:hypothetical protein